MNQDHEKIIGFDPIKQQKSKAINPNSIEGVMQFIFEAIVSRNVYCEEQKRSATPNELYSLIYNNSNIIFSPIARDLWKSYGLSQPICSIKVAPPSRWIRITMFIKHLLSISIIR